MRMVVVLPAPLGPSKPKISPGRASKLMLSTAFTWPRRRSRNSLVRLSTWIILISGGGYAWANVVDMVSCGPRQPGLARRRPEDYRLRRPPWCGDWSPLWVFGTGTIWSAAYIAALGFG